VACLLLHHSGKSSKTGLRGASAMGAMAQNIFKLEPHEKYNVDNGEAWFVLKKDKQRSGGKQFKTFSIHFSPKEPPSSYLIHKIISMLKRVHRYV
jgi:hypothetical protein